MISKFISCFKLLRLKPHQKFTQNSTPLIYNAFSSSEKSRSTDIQKKQMIGDVEVCDLCNMHTLEYDDKENEKYKVAETNHVEILRCDRFKMPSSPYSGTVHEFGDFKLHIPDKPTYPQKYLRMMLTALGKPTSDITAKTVELKLTSYKDDKSNK